MNFDGFSESATFRTSGFETRNSYKAETKTGTSVSKQGQVSKEKIVELKNIESMQVNSINDFPLIFHLPTQKNNFKKYMNPSEKDASQNLRMKKITEKVANVNQRST